MPELNFFVETSLNACTVKRIGLPLSALGESLARLRFYEDDELRRLAEVAGFDRANVVRRDLEPFARQVGVPPDHLSLFAGLGEPFLLAQKAE